MIDKIIDIEKSKTIKTENLVGREAYRKVKMHLMSEMEEGDNYEDCENIVDGRIEKFFEKEQSRLIEEVKQIKKY